MIEGKLFQAGLLIQSLLLARIMIASRFTSESCALLEKASNFFDLSSNIGCTFSALYNTKDTRVTATNNNFIMKVY
jgi:hypothetical protein